VIRIAVAAIALAACDLAGQPVDAPDREVDPECVGAPELTWETFGEGFLISRCHNCHASTTTNRNGAPPSVTLESMDNVRELRERIAARVADATMPPGGGLLEDEVIDLGLWMACDPCAFDDDPECDAETEIPLR
jgi:uncharacterized membrane protein